MPPRVTKVDGEGDVKENISRFTSGTVIVTATAFALFPSRREACLGLWCCEQRAPSWSEKETCPCNLWSQTAMVLFKLMVEMRTRPLILVNSTSARFPTLNDKCGKEACSLLGNLETDGDRVNLAIFVFLSPPSRLRSRGPWVPFCGDGTIINRFTAWFLIVVDRAVPSFSRLLEL